MYLCCLYPIQRVASEETVERKGLLARRLARLFVCWPGLLLAIYGAIRYSFAAAAFLKRDVGLFARGASGDTDDFWALWSVER